MVVCVLGQSKVPWAYLKIKKCIVANAGWHTTPRSANIAPSERLMNGTIVTAAVNIVCTIGRSSSAAALRGIRFPDVYMVGRSQRSGEIWTASSPLIRLGKRGMFAGLHGRGSKPRERGGVANNLTTFICSQACWRTPETSKLHGTVHGVWPRKRDRRRKCML